MNAHPLLAEERPLSWVCCERNADPDGQRARILELLETGADIHETDKNGVTPLHHAVRFRSPAAVETLIEQGANVNRMCKRSGSTRLHRAVTFTGAPSSAGKADERKQIIRLLLKAGADPSIKNRLGRSALDYVKDETTLKLFDDASSIH